MTRLYHILTLLSIGLLLPCAKASAQQSLSAQTALDLVTGRFGPGATQWVSELRGSGGQPQPLQWDILAYSPRSPGLLHRFSVVPGLAEDAGPDTQRYSGDVPKGYFTSTDLGLDSIAAFTIAEGEARKAKLGFDSCDYYLSVREYSRETVWRLELVDALRRLVGSVYISGSNGTVLRTVWISRDSITGFPTIRDSASPEAMPYSPAETGPTTISQMPPQQPGSGIPQISQPPQPITQTPPPFSITTPQPPQPRTGSIFRRPASSGPTTVAPMPQQPIAGATAPVAPDPALQPAPTGSAAIPPPPIETIPLPLPESITTAPAPAPAPTGGAPIKGTGSKGRISAPSLPGQ